MYNNVYPWTRMDILNVYPWDQIMITLSPHMGPVSERIMMTTMIVDLVCKDMNLPSYKKVINEDKKKYSSYKQQKLTPSFSVFTAN